MARINCRFTLRHAAAAPRLRLRDLRVTPVEADLFQIEAVVENTGFLATNLSDQAIAMREAKPVEITLAGPEELIFVQGAPHQSLGHIAGRGSRPMAYSRFYDWPDSARAVRWTVRLADRPADLTLRAGTARAGAVTAKVRIDRDGTATVTPSAAAAGRAQ
jgi:hypothetical protein